ncbi:ATP-binding protein [Candidatus Leptofilum sp.]|uniref:ATP-binding protein n=1 Tax=Candidatus Leptofilum sp. TaxID=3241576 RepID=UPI003B58C204
MSRSLHFHLLGGLQISIPNEKALRFSARRAELLLAYLALNRREHSRENLATLLWDDRPHKQAMANLRALLAQLPKAVRPYLAISRQAVMFQPDAPLWIDSLTFTEQIEQANDTQSLADALTLYAGPFLDGVFVRESRGLEEWTAVLREQLSYQAIEAHLQIVQTSLHQREYATGIRFARALIGLDPLREQAHRLLMRLLARDGQHNAALAQYESCRTILEEELGVEPATETTQLQQRIQAAKQATPSPLPMPATPFVGRQSELAFISQTLDQPNCRLLTLIGAGGVGKTRLALEAATLRQTDYLNGVYFVSLSSVETAADLPLAIANSLNLAFQGQAATESQLLQALANQELLLILDNIEHLLPEAVRFVSRLLQAAPAITLLVTSRERLRLPAEQSFDLMGLTDNDVAEHFFLACARRALPDFTLTAATRTAVHHICQLVDGLPLGIELAAAWVHLLSCAEIAQEIEQNIDFLAAPETGRPARHQSLRAVFEYSWRLLTPAEQGALQRLAVFRGGFTREAAREIGGANLLMLRSLVDKSLLYRANEPNDRYGLLEVLRQHVLDKWDDAEEAATRDSHSRYYGRFLQTHEPNLRSQTRRETVTLLAAELENCRRAWQTAVTRNPLDIPALSSFINSLYAIFHTRAWFKEGYDLLLLPLEKLKATSDSADRNQVLSRLLARLGSLAAYMGQFEQALTHHQDSLAYGRNAATPLDLATNYIGLAQVNDVLGNLTEAQAHAQNAYNLYEAEEDEEGMVVALRKMASAAQGVGKFEEAVEIYRRCLAICRRADDLQGIARASTGVGNALADLGAYEEAQAAYLESLAIYQQMNNQYSTALVLGNIGTIESELGRQAQARTRYEESYAICAKIGDQAGMGIALMNIAITHEREEHLEEARDWYQKGIKILKQVNYVAVLPTALVGIGRVLARLGNIEAGRAYLHESLQLCQVNGLLPPLLRGIATASLLLQLEGKSQRALSFALVAKQHPKSNKETIIMGEQMVAALHESLPPEIIAIAEAWANETPFADVVTAVLAETAPQSP